jgi:pentatricopeptide repeat protein
MEQAFEAGVADTVTYNTIIKAHLLAGNSAEARKAVELMKKAGLQPNCVTFNELLDACVKSDARCRDVWTIIDEMDACGVKPNHITCSILLKTIDSNSAGNNVERILKVLDAMPDDMDEVLLSSVVEACIRVGRVDLLMPYLKRQGSSRRIQVRGPHTYGSIIRAYGFVKDIAGAWETWREMRTRHIVPTSVTLGCMVEAVVSNGDPEAGYELIREMLKDEQCCVVVNAVIYCSVVKGFSHQKNFARVWAVYQEMLVQRVQFSIVTFNTLVDACSRSGEMNRIPALLESMVSQGIEPNLITYSAILKGYCQENRLDEAFELMEGMVQTTKFKPDEIMYNSLLDGCARQGLYDRGIKLLGEMEKVGVRPSNFTLSVLVKMASRAKKLDQAFDLAEQLSSKYRFKLNIHVYSNLIQACILNKDLPRAFEVLERLTRERVRLDGRTYSLLLKASVAAGEAADAAGLLRAAVGLRGVHPRLMGADPKLLQPQQGLAPALIAEVLEGISGPCGDEGLAVALLKDLRTKPHVKLDSRMQLRLTAQAMGTGNNRRR